MNAETLSVTSSDNGVVIIGAGLAGWHVIDAIRAKDKDIPITLVTTDSGDRYHKPMLTMAISQNKRASDLVRATGTDAAEAAQVTLLANTHVVDIDPVAQTIQLDTTDSTGTPTSLSYDKMVLAMGAHPIFPKSLPEDLVWHVNHIERFGQLQEKLATGSQHVAIVGAGMVGTEIAEDLLKAGHQVTLIDLNDAPLSQMLPAKATDRIAKAVQSQGINFLGGYQVSGVRRINDGDEAHESIGKLQVSYEPITSSSDGNNDSSSQTVVVDHVIASTGLTVDDKLPTAAGVEFDRRTGIVVDAPTLRTHADNIYAIGDCMSINGVACRYVAPLRAQAATIADDILGLEHGGYDHKPPMIRLKNKAISVMATGVPQANGNWQVKSESDDELVMELFDDNNDVSATVTIKAPATPSA
ncbi:MAG: FAD-dependent oxidoreductase [Psychrobacter alimentarius]